MEELNKKIFLEENIESILIEVEEREEFVCTGDVCGAQACGVYNL